MRAASEVHSPPRRISGLAHNTGGKVLGAQDADQGSSTPATAVRRWEGRTLDRDQADQDRPERDGQHSCDFIISRIGELLAVLGIIHTEVTQELADVSKRANACLAVLLSPSSPARDTSKKHMPLEKQEAADRLRSALVRGRRRIAGCLDRERMALTEFAETVGGLGASRKAEAGPVDDKEKPEAVPVTPVAAERAVKPIVEKRLHILEKMERYLARRADACFSEGDSLALSNVQRDLEKVHAEMARLRRVPLAPYREQVNLPEEIPRARNGFDRLIKKISEGPTPRKGHQSPQYPPPPVAGDSSWGGSFSDFSVDFDSPPRSAARFASFAAVEEDDKENVWPWLPREVVDACEAEDECLIDPCL
jgi:hypothetical protein